MSETLHPVNPASFLDFVFLGNSDSGLTNIWSVQTALAPLGRVQWYAPWRRYWFVPLEGTGFDAACLKEISRSSAQASPSATPTNSCSIRDETRQESTAHD